MRIQSIVVVRRALCVLGSLGVWLLLGGCVSPKPMFSDSEWIAHTTTGNAAYERGDFASASHAYALAVKRAQAMDDPEALAVAAANRAAVLFGEGKYDEVRLALSDSFADPRVSQRRRSELLVIAARAQHATGDLQGALSTVASALQLSPQPRVHAKLLFVQCAVVMQQGNVEAAKSILDKIPSQKGWKTQPSAMRAEHAELSGRVAERQEQPRDAMVSYDTASLLWKEAERLPEMARALANAGRQAQVAGDAEGASSRLYRSARSLWAQGYEAEALSVMEEVTELAAAVGDEVMGRRMAEWLRSLGVGSAR